MGMREVTEEDILVAQARAYHRPASQWWLYRRELADGRVIILAPVMWGCLLGISSTSRVKYYDDVWDYPAEHTDGGWTAALGWDGEGEPEGWYRHARTGRRRPGGDPSKEHVRE